VPVTFGCSRRRPWQRWWDHGSGGGKVLLRFGPQHRQFHCRVLWFGLRDLSFSCTCALRLPTFPFYFAHICFDFTSRCFDLVWGMTNFTRLWSDLTHAYFDFVRRSPCAAAAQVPPPFPCTHTPTSQSTSANQHGKTTLGGHLNGFCKDKGQYIWFCSSEVYVDRRSYIASPTSRDPKGQSSYGRRNTNILHVRAFRFFCCTTFKKNKNEYWRDPELNRASPHTIMGPATVIRDYLLH
jgi:hypothetical protein